LKPCSASVGAPGAKRLRVVPVVASTRHLPLSACGTNSPIERVLEIYDLFASYKSAPESTDRQSEHAHGKSREPLRGRQAAAAAETLTARKA
jgi:hypothetical protein